MFAFNDDQKAAVLAAWPGLAPSQLAALAKRVADNGGEDSAKATSGRDCVYYLQMCHVSKDASLVRPPPTAAQYVEHMVAQKKADGLPFNSLTLAREAQDMDADALLAAVPASSAALKAPVAAATKTTKAPTTLDDWVAVAAESNGFNDAKSYVQSVGPNAARNMAEHLKATAARPKIDERPGHVKQASGNAAVDALTADPEFAKLSPQERMSRFREAQSR